MRINASVEGDAVGGGVIGIIGIEMGVGQHELGLMNSIFSDDFGYCLRGGKKRVIARIEETNFSAEDAGSASGFCAANFFDAVDGHARLFPGALAFAAFAKGKAENSDAIATAGIESDGAAGTPDEIGGMRAEDEDVFGGGVFHVMVPGPEGCRKCGRT